MKYLFLSLVLVLGTQIYGQEAQSNMTELPYYEIPKHPAEYTAETVVARMLDGLGFRYYWASEGLRPEDLSFSPSETARTSEATIDHILGLTKMVLNAIKQLPNTRGGGDKAPLSFAEKRAQTLMNIKEASDLLKSGDLELENCKIIFQRGETRSEMPFWNSINGPIEDAVWHVGQIVTFRRASGNPFNSKASVLSGKVRK